MVEFSREQMQQIPLSERIQRMVNGINDYSDTSRGNVDRERELLNARFYARSALETIAETGEIDSIRDAYQSTLVQDPFRAKLMYALLKETDIMKSHSIRGILGIPQRRLPGSR